MTYIRSIMLVGWIGVLAQFRRVLTSVLLVALPILLFAAMRTNGRSLGIAALGVGTSWSLAILATFTVHTTRGLDARLVISGLNTSRIFLGRLLSLVALTVLVACVLAIVVPLIDDGVSARVIFLGLVMAGPVAIAAGLLLGTLMPGELEAVLVIIGIFGLPLGLSLDSAALPWTPGYGPILYLQYLGDRTDAAYFLHAGLTFVGCTVLAWILWWRATHRAVALR